MNRPELAVVHRVETSLAPILFPEMLADHHALLQSYLDTHITRNHSDRTLDSERRFLTGWFEGFIVPDDAHPEGQRQLLLWEAMTPLVGRQRVVAFSKGLAETGLKPRTIISYLGYLRRLYQYVLDYPYIPGDVAQPIAAK